MGESGSGKTTLTKIILGLLPGYTGNVWYGEQEQKEINTEDLYNHIAYVDQQVYLFQDTLRFNYHAGDALHRRGNYDGYSQMLFGRLCVFLAGGTGNGHHGERQKPFRWSTSAYCFGSCLNTKIQYIILDEGTSALDEANALDIENNLLSTQDMGVIIITHNLRECIREKLTAVYSLA